MDGIILVDKPKGISSFAVVAQIRRLISETGGQKVKIGHTGTLDPMASGLLIMVVGNYTKRAGEFSKLDKTYQAELTLGAASTTGDSEGIITPKSGVKPPKSEVLAALQSFQGQIQQTPPAYSAIKVGGKRAYKLARQGREVKIDPRAVQIYEIELLKYKYPKVSFRARVSSGTYIRSLAEDIGAKLGTSAFLSDLKRTQVGNYDLQDALKTGNLRYLLIKQHLKQ